MSTRLLAILTTILLGGLARADDFDRLEGQVLSGVPKSADASKREQLTTADLGTLPNVLVGTRSPLVVVKTDEANHARLLVSPALRQPPGGKGEPFPILVIERFETFEGNTATKRLAKGRELTLFDGFRFDLDSGQVVPEGQGGDVQFLAGGEGGPRLVALKGASMFTLAKSPLAAAKVANQPSSGRSVLKGDFAGTYRLFANGQTSGRLDLEVDNDGVVTGRFRSDQTGGAYKVTGQAGIDPANKLRFAVELPRARQEFEGFLFVEGKGAISGSFTLLERPFGFFAVRQGATLSPDGEDAGDKIEEARPGKIVIEVKVDSMSIGDKTGDSDLIAGAMKAALAADPATWALLRVAPDAKAGNVLKLADELRTLGIKTIRFEAATR
jgi:hypothetical protein